MCGRIGREMDLLVVADFRVSPFNPTSRPFDLALSSQKGGDPAALSSTATLLRLHPPYQAYLRHRPPLQVGRATSGTPNSGGVTGGVYKARERIHRAMLMRDY
jgi:hypothetical protein